MPTPEQVRAGNVKALPNNGGLNPNAGSKINDVNPASVTNPNAAWQSNAGTSVQQTTTSARMQAAAGATTLAQKVAQLGAATGNAVTTPASGASGAESMPQAGGQPSHYLPSAAVTTLQKQNGISQPGATSEGGTVTNDMDNGDGTRTVTYADGSVDRVKVTPNQDGSENYTVLSPDAGIKYDTDKGVADATARHTQEVSYANTTLDGIKSLTDTATSALIDSIKQTFGARIEQMKISNANVFKTVTQSGLRSGRARYAPELQQGILTDTENQGIARIGTLQGEMLSAIADAQKAQTANDISLFNTRMNALQKADSELQTTVQNLHKNALDELQEIRNKAKAATDLEHQQLQDSMDMSKRVAPGLVDEMENFKTPEEQAAFIGETAKALNIDPEILMGDFEDALSKNNKSNLDIENIKDQMANRAKTTAISAGNLQLAREKQNFNPTADERSKVMQWLTDPTNGATKVDVERAKTMPEVFYAFLKKAGGVNKKSSTSSSSESFVQDYVAARKAAQ